jgi:hypothetical protein
MYYDIDAVSTTTVYYKNIVSFYIKLYTFQPLSVIIRQERVQVGSKDLEVSSCMEEISCSQITIVTQTALEINNPLHILA